MAESFDDLYSRGNNALFRDDAEALASFTAALRAAEHPADRAFALDGMACANLHLKRFGPALEQLDQAIALCGPLADEERVAAYALAQALYDKAGILSDLERFEDALEALEPLLSRFSDAVSADAEPADNAELRLKIARATRMKTTALYRLNRKREAISCCDDMIRRFAPFDEADVEEQVARAMLARAWVLSDLGYTDEEVVAYDALVARYGGNRRLSVRHTIVDALSGKLQCYRDQGDFEGALAACDEIIHRYGTDAGDGIAERVARTMIRRANLLNKMGKIGEELACYDKVVLDYGGRADPELRQHAAKALMFKAVTLNDADQAGAEMECYEEILRRYAEDADERVRAVAADALVHKGLSLGALAEDAAADTGIRETGAEIACYDQVIQRYGEETSVRVQQVVAEALLHKGETLVEAGRIGEASICLDSVIADYGSIDDEPIREIVKDAMDLKAGI